MIAPQVRVVSAKTANAASAEIKHNERVEALVCIRLRCIRRTVLWQQPFTLREWVIVCACLCGGVCKSVRMLP